MQTPLERAANSASAKMCRGMPFQAAVGTSSRESGIAFKTIAAELSKRSSHKKKPALVEDAGLNERILEPRLRYGED